MLQPYEGSLPAFDGRVWVHETAVLIGRVRLGEGVSVWPQAVLRADYNTITVGQGSNIQDGAVLHNDHGHPCVLGKDCVIGHGAVVHGAALGDRVLIGIHATVLNGAVVGDECIIGAGAVVGEGKQIPPRSLVLGVPGKVVRPITADELKRITDGAANYRGYAERQLPALGG